MKVESKISELIISLLERYERIAVKGIGTFFYVNKDAEINPDNQVITPPGKKLSISVSKQGEPSLILKAIEHQLILESEAAELKRYLGLIALALSRDNVYDIEGLGRVGRDASGTHLSLISADFSSKLPIVELVELTPTTESKELDKISDVDQSMISSNVDGEADALEDEININIHEETSPSSQIESAQLLKANAESTDIKNQPTDLSVFKEPLENQNRTLQGDTKIPSQSKLSERPTTTADEGSFLSSYALPLFAILFGLALMAYCIKTCVHDPSDFSNDHSTSTLDVQPHQPIEDLEYRASDEAGNIEKYKDILTDDIVEDGCQIVVGTFVNALNAESLAGELSVKSYATRLVKNGDQTRVVITFDCREHDLIEYFNVIRRDVSDKAWFLSPLFEPEKYGQ